jgi:hypothetical protein
MKSFLSGRQQIVGGGLQPMTNAVAKPAIAGLPGHAHGKDGAASGGATVQCIKQGEQIVRLIVTCTCGEKIEIDCQYPN